MVAVVAQWIEHGSSEPVVGGSNPPDRAILGNARALSHWTLIVEMLEKIVTI